MKSLGVEPPHRLAAGTAQSEMQGIDFHKEDKLGGPAIERASPDEESTPDDENLDFVKLRSSDADAVRVGGMRIRCGARIFFKLYLWGLPG